MITWIQHTFQKHTKLIFLFLLLVVAVPFVFVINPSSGVDRSGRKMLERPFFNYNLGSADDQERIFGDAELSIFLQAGYMALSGGQLQDYALQRVAALHLAGIHGMPQPSQKQLTDHLTTLRLFQNQQGEFDAKRYTDFTDSLKDNPQITRADLARVLSDDVRLIQVQEIIGGPGYVMPAEVKSQLVRGGTEWTIGVATTDLNAFTPEVPVNELNLAAWFDENVARYRTPPRVSVDYVTFRAADYTQEVDFTEDDLLAYYKANPARFPGSADEAAAPAETDGIPLAFRSAVESALRDELAAKRAVHAASDFAVALIDRKIVRNSTGLDDLVAGFKAVRRTAPSFSANEPPKELNWPPSAAQAAFKLGEKRFFSDPITLADGSAIVLLWNETIEPGTPSLAQVRDAVVRDFTAAERRRMFVEAGSRWRADLQARIRSGMSLEAAAAAIGAPKFEVVAHPAFTRRAPPEGIEPAALSMLDQTAVGELSGFIPTGEKGIIVHVAARNEPVIDENSPEYTMTREQLSRLSANLGQNVVLSALVERELGRSGDIEP